MKHLMKICIVSIIWVMGFMNPMGMNAKGVNYLIAIPSAAHTKVLKPTKKQAKEASFKERAKRLFYKAKAKLKTLKAEVFGDINIFALLSLVFAVAGLVLFFTVGYGLYAGVAAIILGIIGISQVNNGNGTGKGLAITGIVLGGLLMVFSILILAALIAWAVK